MPNGEDTLVLQETDRAKLDGIVQQMVANKESDDNIQFVVSDFKTKYGKKKVQEQVTTPPLQNGGQPVSNNTPTTSTSDAEKLQQVPLVGQSFTQQNLQNQQLESKLVDIPIVGDSFRQNSLENQQPIEEELTVESKPVGNFGTGFPKDPVEFKQMSKDIFSNALQRGVNQGNVADILALNRVPTEDELGQLAKIQKDNQELKSSEAYQQFNKAETFGDAMSAFVSSPTAALSIISELSLESLAALATHGVTRVGAGALTGGAAGSVVPVVGTGIGIGAGVIAGMGMASMNLEYGGQILDTLQEAGIDITDVESLKSAFKDEALIDKARTIALKKGIPVALFDMVSIGLGGKLVSKPATKFAGKALQWGGEIGLQAGLGAGGELTSELVAGQKISVPSILGEAFGELGGGLPDIFIGKSIEDAKNDKSALKNLTEIKTDVTPQEYSDAVDIRIGTGEITKEQGDKLKTEFKGVVSADKSIPPETTEEKKKELIPLIMEFDAKEAEIENAHKTLQAPLKEELKDIQSKIDEVYTTDSKDKTEPIELTPTKTEDVSAQPSEEVGVKVPPNPKEETATVTEAPKEEVGSVGVGGDVPQFAAKSGKHFEYVPIEEVDAYKEFDRETDKKFDKKELDDLTEDIRKNGIKNPIQIKVDRNGKALIVEGNTRLAAAKRLGIKNIPVEIIEGEFGSINKDKAKSLPDVGRSELQRRQQTELGLKDNNGAYSKGFTRVEQSLKETPTPKGNTSNVGGDVVKGTKVADKEGNPVVVYHGSGRGGKNGGVIEKFDESMVSKDEIDFPVNGFFFAGRKGEAEIYGGEKNTGSYYVDIKNPASRKDVEAAVNEVRNHPDYNKDKGEYHNPTLVRKILIEKGFDGYIPTPFGKPNMEKLESGDVVKFDGKYFKYDKAKDEVLEFDDRGNAENLGSRDALDVMSLEDFKNEYSEKGIFIAFKPEQIHNIKSNKNDSKSITEIGEMDGNDIRTKNNETENAPEKSLSKKEESVEQSLKETTKAGSVGVGGDVKQQELDAQKVNKEAGVDIYVARQGVDANGSKYTLSQINENGNTNTFLIEDANGNEVGKAQLSADGNYLENIRIDEKHRRKGLASKVYDFIELRKGIELEPSPNKQSKEAKALWDNRNLKKSVSNKANGGLLAKALGEAMSKTFADFKNKQQVLLELENKYFEQKGLSKEDFNKLNETEKAEIIKDAVKWKNDNPELVKAVEQSLKETTKAETQKVEAPIPDVPLVEKNKKKEKTGTQDLHDTMEEIYSEIRNEEDNKNGVVDVNGYKFTKTPTLDKVIAEPIPKDNIPSINEQLFVGGSNNVLQKGVSYEGGGWYKFGEDNYGGVHLYNTVTKEGVTLNHKQGGRTGIVLHDFIKNNSRYNDNIAVRGSKFTEAEHNPKFGGSGHYKGTYFYVGLSAESKALEHGKNLSKVDIENANLYELGEDGQTSQSLKNEAKKAGYDTRDASGYAESEYLKKQGYDGIQRGNEIVLFEPKKFELKPTSQKSDVPLEGEKSVGEKNEIILNKNSEIYREGKKGQWFSKSDNFSDHPMRKVKLDSDLKLLDIKDGNWNKLFDLATPDELKVLKSKYSPNTEQSIKSDKIKDDILERNGYDGVHTIELGSGEKEHETYYLTKKNSPDFKSEQPIKEEKNIPEKKVEDFTDEEMQKAYDEQAKELKKLRGADYKFQILHDEGLQMTRDDFNHYGDRNLAKGDRKFEKYFSSKALPLDKKLKSLSDQYEIEITPQDAIDYILDKNDNPLKYRESTSKTLGRNAKIPIKLADTINNLGIKTEADVEALRGFPLDDAEANLIIDYLKNNKNEKENITNESAKPSGSEDRPTTKEGEGLEGKTAKEKVTVTPPEAPKEIVEPPKKEISEGAKKSKKELAKEELEQARAEFKKAGGLSSGGFEATPQLVKLIKAYIKYGIESAKEAYKLFKEDFPDAKVKQEDFESVFDEQSLTGITRAEVKKMRDALGLGDFEKVTRHDADLYKDAEKWIEDGGDVQGLIKEYQDRKFTIDLDLGNTVLNIYKADLEAKLKTDASDANIKLAADIAHALDTAGNIFGRGLRSMQSQRPVVESLVDMYTAKQEANNVDSLTDLQKAEVQRLFDLNKKAKEEAEANYKKLEEAFSKYKAEKELGKMKKESKPKANKTHEEFVKERKDLIAKFKDAGKPKDGEAKRSGAPISDEQVKIVLQIAKSYLSEGLTNLGIIVDNISDSLGLDKDIVHNTIAGDYTQKHTRNELAEKMKDLRDEAMYANKLKALMNGEKPTTEKGRVERNQKIKDLQDKIASFKKEQADAEKQKIEDAKIKKSAEEIALEQIIKNNEKRANEIREKIAKGEFTTEKKLNLLENPEVKKQFPDLHKKAIDSITAKEDAGHEWDIAVMKDKMAQRHWLKKYVVDIGADALGTLKSVVTGIDDSAVFVQNLYALITHYKSAPHALVGHLTDFWSEKNFSRWLTEMHNSSSWDLIVKSGLNVTEPKSLIEKNKEEVFNRSLLDRPIKIKGKEYVIGKYTTQPFERMFTSLGNRLRVGIFLRGAEKLYSQGKTWENSPKEFTDLANILNTETGRGKLPEVIQKASPIITPVIWSPRLMQSTINILGISDAANALRGKKGYYGDLTPQMRKMAFADLGKFTATAIATIGLFALAGWQPDLDPRSVKFGTLTKNGKSINILGRFSSYIRLVAQVATGTEKKDNVVTDLEKGGRAKKIGRFMWGKMTPIAGTAVDLAMDENYMHEPVSVGTEVPKMFTPISIQGMIGGWRNEGAMSLINTDLPSFIGVPISFAADFKIKMPESIKVGDNQVKLTEQQQQEYQDWYDLKSEAYLNNLINLDTYKNADDKAKQEMRMVVINSAKGEAKAQIEKTYKNQFTETKEQVDERFKEATDLWELKRSVGIDAGKKPQRGDYKAHKVEGKSTLKIYTP